MQTDTASSTTRRRLLAKAGAAGAAALAAGAADPHPAWEAEWRLRMAEVNQGGTDEETDGPFERGLELEDLIAATPAASVAGVRAQVALVHHSLTEVGSFGPCDVQALTSAIATLDRLAATGRRA